MSQIKITSHEFKMLRDDYHPEFTFKYAEDEDSIGIMDEEGSGADIIYKKTLIRKSDNKEFILKSTYNTASEFIHDEPFSCDFVIDSKKEDTLDPFNELDLEGKKKRKEAKLLKDKEDKKQEELQANLNDFDIENPVIPVDEYRELCLGFLKTKTFHDLQVYVKEVTAPLALKYNLETGSLHYPLTTYHNSKDKMMKMVLKYEKNYNKNRNITKVISVKVQGQILELSETEARSILKQLKYEV